MLRRPVGTYIVVGAVLGVISLVLGLAKVKGLSVVLDVLLLATAFAGGFAAQSRGGRPAWMGAAVGALYGVLSGAKAFGQHLSAGQIRSALTKSGHSGAISVGHVVGLANSPAVHVLTIVVTGVVWGVVGLVLGAIAGAVAGGREQQRRAV